MQQATPVIIYGTAWKKERTSALVAEAIRLGFRAVDTAGQPKHYNEAGVGAGIAAALSSGIRRADLYLQTKFTPVDGHDPNRIPYDPRAPLEDQVAQSFHVSLENLRTDYLDALVLHSPLPDQRQLLSVWAAMERIADTGGARRLGISNCYDAKVLAALHRASRIKPAIVQNRFYAQTGYDVAIRRFCREHEIVYQSFWTLTANAVLLDSAAVRAPAAQHERTPAQVLFRYLTQRGVVPLTGTTSSAHMREALEIFEFELDASECEAIDRIVGATDPAQ